jgi:His/Glu/Gln/Arg/opine family amino acid ABC transporter permease subunit
LESLLQFSDRIALPHLIKAAQYPLLLTAIAMPLAVIFGLILALMRTSRSAWLSWPAATYIEIVRGTPLLVQIFLAYYSLPLLSPSLRLEAVPCGIICLAANYAAYEAEVHRAGLQAVDKGQLEAALSIGMGRGQAFRLIIFPQAFRIVLPPVINDSIAMLKDSCLTSVIGVPELLDRAKAIGKERYNYEEMYVAASVLYMIMSLSFYFVGKWVESRLKVKGGQELEVKPHGH